MMKPVPAYKDRYWHPANLAAVRELAEATKAAGRSLVSLALGWLLDPAAIARVIVGASGTEPLAEDLAAAKGRPLTPETLAACDAVWKQIRRPAPQCNR